MAANVIRSEVPVNCASITQNSATVDELIDMAVEIYKEIIDYCDPKRTKKVPKDAKELNGKTLLSRFNDRVVVHTESRDEDDYIAPTNEEYKGLVKYLQDKYRDFNASFPIFIRWTVQTGEFNEVAFRKFLNKYSRQKMKSMDDFLELQTDYVLMLYKEKHPHYNQSRLQQLHVDMMKSLIKEHKDFKDVAKDVDKEMEEQKKKNIAHIREQMFQLLNTKTTN